MGRKYSACVPGCDAVHREWRIGQYRFERWPHVTRERWSVGTSGLCAGGHATPLGAWLALRRAMAGRDA